MIVVICKSDDRGALARVQAHLERSGLRHELIVGRGRRRVVAVDAPSHAAEALAALPDVGEIHAFEGPYGLVSRALHAADTSVPFGSRAIGGSEPFVVLAGPCSVESVDQLLVTATAVAGAGAVGLRGGAYKPRTSPYAFQGLGREGLEILRVVRERSGLPVVTEVMAPEDVDAVSAVADMLQVGSRNIQNFRLLDAVGRSHRPVLLKRGMSTTLDEFLAAAEYVYVRGNTAVVLCERGIRTFEPRLRNTLDLGGVALLKRLSHLPVIVDPSHGTGLSELVTPLARASLAVGADGLLIEVHPHPESALSDGRQSLTPVQFAALMAELAPLAGALGRPLAAALPEPAAASLRSSSSK